MLSCGVEGGGQSSRKRHGSRGMEGWAVVGMGSRTGRQTEKDTIGCA